MRTLWFGYFLFVLLFALSGCSAQVATIDDGTPEDTTTRLSDKIDVSLADWLQLPRVELAKLVEEWTETVGKQRELARSSAEVVQLLPQLHPPVVAVGFVEAKFSPTVGFSLPPYLKEGQKDAAVALHLARFGDFEAARKLADPADKDLLAKIEASRGERNYPIEWTRLVSLVLQNAELKLANGEPEGAAELVLLHRQLRSLLDARAASSLGAALLSRGRQALTLAAAAWRAPRWNKIALASDVFDALAEWGEVPDPVFAFSSAGWEQGEKTGNRIAQTPLAVQRALDLLALPLPSEGADGVAAFLDAKQNLTELLIVYRPKLSELFPEPRHLALPLLEHGYKSDGDVATSPGLTRQIWTGGGLSYEIAVLARGNIGGAVIRVFRRPESESEGKASVASASGSLRDFGAVHLDRSFEQNRLNLAPDRTGTALEIKDADQLAAIAQPVTKHALAGAILRREANEDLLARLTLRWPADQNRNALSQLALPLWAAYGPARLESVEEAGGGCFVIAWQNETTRLKLNLLFEDKAPELLVEDSRGPAVLKARAVAVAEFDRRERQERLAAGKPHQRLRRFVRLAAHGIDDLQLGLTRKHVLAVLSSAYSVRVQALADGLSVLVLNEPPATVTHWPRQLFVRFGADNRVAEIRVRYQEGPQPPGPKSPGLLDKLRAKPNGLPESLPPTWAGLWSDLPTRKQAELYRWRDDVTCLTYQRDSGGSEVVLRDCSSASHDPRETRSELPPLQFCRRGVEGCALGDSHAEVHKRWRISNPLLASNGAEVLAMPESSPYDVLLVWYDNDKVSRLIARHRQPRSLKAEEAGPALQQAWAADLDRLGYVRRHDAALGQVLQSYSFHDDRTRVRLFAQESEGSIRLFTEWRQWPIPARTLVSK